MSEILFLAAIIPVILILRFIVSVDRKPESSALLRKLFYGGVIGSIGITTVVNLLYPVLLGEEVYKSFAGAYSGIKVVIHYFLMVGLLEEFSKWIMILLLGYPDKEFDEMYDGIVYATFVSLGFAALENILYVRTYGLENAIIRAFISVPGHASFGVVMGLFLSKAKREDVKNKEGGKSIFYLALSLILPVLIHGAFDTCLSMNKNIYVIIFYIMIIIVNVSVVLIILKVSSKDERIVDEVKNQPATVNKCPGCGCPEVGNRFCIKCGTRIRE